MRAQEGINLISTEAVSDTIRCITLLHSRLGPAIPPEAQEYHQFTMDLSAMLRSLFVPLAQKSLLKEFNKILSCNHLPIYYPAIL